MAVWASGLAVVVSAAALALAGMFAVRHAVPFAALAPTRDAAGALYSVLGAAYAVLLAFVVVAAWDHYDAADRRVDTEANSLGMLFGQVQALPPPVRNALEADIRSYAVTVVEKEWPAMAHGRAAPEAWVAYRTLWRRLQTYTPATPQEGVWYEAAIQQLTRLDDLRGLRLASSRVALPRVLWVVLALGGAITVGFSYLVAVSSARTETAMVVALAAMLALILFTVVALERPFGLVPIKPDAFHDLIGFFDSWMRRAE